MIKEDERLFSRAAEGAVLASVILDNTYLDKVAAIIGVATFGYPEHQTIYQAILDLREVDAPIDGLVLREKLDEQGHLDKIGGVSYLQEILDNVPSADNCTYYAKIV